MTYQHELVLPVVLPPRITTLHKLPGRLRHQCLVTTLLWLRATVHSRTGVAPALAT